MTFFDDCVLCGVYCMCTMDLYREYAHGLEHCNAVPLVTCTIKESNYQLSFKDLFVRGQLPLSFVLIMHVYTYEHIIRTAGTG